MIDLESNVRFLIIIIMFIVSVFLHFSSGKNRHFSYYLSLSATIMLALFFLPGKDKSIFSTFYFSKNDNNVLFSVSVLSVILAVLLKAKSYKLSKNIITYNALLFVSIALIGSTNFISFFVAYMFLNILELIFLKVSASDEKFFENLFIKSFLIVVFFILGIGLFYLSTGTLSLVEFKVKNQELYALSVVFIVITCAYQMGCFPFHSHIIGSFSNMDKRNLPANGLIKYIVLSFSLLRLTQDLFLYCDPSIQKPIANCIIFISICSVLFGSFMLFSESKIKKAISYMLVFYAGIIFLTLLLDPIEGYQRNTLFYLLFFSLSLMGVVLIVNDLTKKSSIQDQSLISMKGMFYANKYMVGILVVFILSLAGFPLTAGFSIKYNILTDLIEESYYWHVAIILICFALTYFFFLRMICLFFDKSGRTFSGEITQIRPRLNTKIAQIVLVLLVLVSGFIPSLFV